MNLSDFQDIRYFTHGEILRTGADIKDVQKKLFLGLDRIRADIGRRILLLRNGLTTGDHASKQHPNGLAADFRLDLRDGTVDQNVLYCLFQSSITHGFRGIGFYYNGDHWSFHLDYRIRLDVWTGRRTTPNGPWVYKRMSIGHPAY